MVDEEIPRAIGSSAASFLGDSVVTDLAEIFLRHSNSWVCVVFVAFLFVKLVLKWDIQCKYIKAKKEMAKIDAEMKKQLAEEERKAREAEAEAEKEARIAEAQAKTDAKREEMNVMHEMVNKRSQEKKARESRKTDGTSNKK